METHRVLTEKCTNGRWNDIALRTKSPDDITSKQDDLALMMMRKSPESQCHCQGGKLGGLASQSESGVKAFG